MTAFSAHPRDDGTSDTFCATQRWYGWEDGAESFIGCYGFINELDKLVGAHGEFGVARNPVLRTRWAYNVAYKHLTGLLPKCRNCRCLMVSSNRGSLCKALLSGRTCAGFRVVFAVGTTAFLTCTNS